jgi:CBS domain-containing protein
MSMFAKLIRTIQEHWKSESFHRRNGMAVPIRKTLDARVAGTQFEIPRHPRVEPLTVKSVLRKRPLRIPCVGADATSLEALKLMAEHDVGAVLVLDGGSLVGIFSERDYARSSVRTIQLPTVRPVGEVMTPCAIFATPSDSAQQCLSLMIDNHYRYLPVQEEGNLVTLLLLEDILNEMVAYLERVFKEYELDQQIVFLRGTYSC